MEPEIVDEIYQVISNVERVSEVTEVRVRWLGHRLYAEVNIAVDPLLSVAEGHEIAVEVRHRMIHNLGPFKRSRYMWIHSDRLGKHFTGSRNMNKKVYL